MNFRRSLLLSAGILIFVFGCGKQPSIKVGLDETIVTPAVGTPMLGYDRGGNVSTGVHDDLYARTIAFEGSDGTSAIMMTVGVAVMQDEMRDDIRAGIEEKTGIPSDHIIISCTHTHSGPDFRWGDDYGNFLTEKCIESGISAWNSREPAKVGIESTEVFGLALNDRRMMHGGVHMDPEVGIIKVENARGKLRGVFFNYGCHPSTLDLHNLLFTEDWPYFSIRGIKDKVGDDVIVGYFQSAQGDAKVGYTAELSAVGADMDGLRSFEFAEKKGLLMTDAVLEKLPSIKTSGDLVVKASSDFFDFPRRGRTYPVSYNEALRQARAARARLEEIEAKSHLVGKRVLDNYRVEAWLAEFMLPRAKWCEENPDPSPLSKRMQALRIGDAVFVSWPNEVFVEIGLKAKQASPYEKIYIIGIASGFLGYIPSADEYTEGGYAVVGTWFAPECEQVLINSSLELINRVSDNDVLRDLKPAEKAL